MAMAGTIHPSDDPELHTAEWDLGPLVDGGGEDGARRLLGEATARAGAFAERYMGRLALVDAAELTEATAELTAIRDTAERARAYAELNLATDTADAARGALSQSTQEALAQLDRTLVFFELEWAALGDERAEALIAQAAGTPGFPAHHLRRLRRRRSHQLSAPEERILADKRGAAHDAWVRLFNEQSATVRFEVDGEEINVATAFNRRRDADPAVRRATHDGFMAALEPGIRTRAFIFNTLMHEQSVEDRLRGHRHWLSAWNLNAEVADETVQALVDAVWSRRDIPQRWFALKARLLGQARPSYYDFEAPVFDSGEHVPYAEARAVVLDAYTALSPQAGAIARRFFDEHWIDAPVRDDKYAGAFCEYGAPSVHPYVMLNYGGSRGDILIMAHELGHGLHGVLSQPRGKLEQETPMTIAETASVFGETLVLEQLLAAAASDRERLGLLAAQLDGATATVFWQVAFNRFEHLAHTRRRREGELSAETLSGLWTGVYTEMFGDGYELPAGTEREWSIVPHFFWFPGYVYAYAFGQLLALSAYAHYRELGPAFVPDYLGMLAAGGSRPPEELAAMIGVDLTDPGFWNAGLALIDERLAAAETLAAALPLTQ